MSWISTSHLIEFILNLSLYRHERYETSSRIKSIIVQLYTDVYNTKCDIS